MKFASSSVVAYHIGPDLYANKRPNSSAQRSGEPWKLISRNTATARSNILFACFCVNALDHFAKVCQNRKENCLSEILVYSRANNGIAWQLLNLALHRNEVGG